MYSRELRGDTIRMFIRGAVKCFTNDSIAKYRSVKTGAMGLQNIKIPRLVS